MIVQNDNKNTADLITLEGDRVSIKNILSKRDYFRLKRLKKLSRNDLQYLNKKYPELLGAWPVIIAKIAKGAIGVGKGIAGKVRQKKAAKKKAAKKKAKIKADEQRRNVAIQNEKLIIEKKETAENKKNQVMIIAAITGIVMIVLIKKKRG